MFPLLLASSAEICLEGRGNDMQKKDLGHVYTQDVMLTNYTPGEGIFIVSSNWKCLEPIAVVDLYWV